VGCEVILTDGLGVFLVVMVRPLRLLKPPKSRKRAEMFAKQVGMWSGASPGICVLYAKMTRCYSPFIYASCRIAHTRFVH
jgi:hypothetical protein